MQRTKITRFTGLVAACMLLEEAIVAFGKDHEPMILQHGSRWHLPQLGGTQNLAVLFPLAIYHSDSESRESKKGLPFRWHTACLSILVVQ